MEDDRHQLHLPQVNLFILGGSAVVATAPSARQWLQTTSGDPTKQELSPVPFSWTVAELLQSDVDFMCPVIEGGRRKLHQITPCSVNVVCRRGKPTPLQRKLCHSKNT